MNDADRSFALRMIPYGVYVVTAVDPATMEVAGAVVHWVTQTSFSPPLLAVCLPAAHPAMALVRRTRRFALNCLGKDDAAEALCFRRPVALTGTLEAGDAQLGGWPVAWGRHGTLLLGAAVAVLECHVEGMMEAGDHHPLFVTILDAHRRLPPAGRPDSMLLRLEDMGETIFYGG